MAWFLRKAFRLGPLRINLSKRGLGASVGVKGFRVGVDAEGHEYVAGGRHGVYFRERIAGAAPTPPPAEASPGPPVTSRPGALSGRPRRWAWLLVAGGLLVALGWLLGRLS